MDLDEDVYNSIRLDDLQDAHDAILSALEAHDLKKSGAVRLSELRKILSDHRLGLSQR